MDPVATLAIFQVLDVDPVLNMLVFGESILNDAVAIVMVSANQSEHNIDPITSLQTIAVIESDSKTEIGIMSQLGGGISRFFGVFFGSAAIGILVALLSSLVLKHIDLYTNPSLEVLTNQNPVHHIDQSHFSLP